MKTRDHAAVKSLTNTVLKATIITGILDALAAVTVYGIFHHYNPLQVYQFVASGLLGSKAYAGGLPAALLGLLIHFGIAFVSSFLFIRFYPGRLLINSGHAVLAGLIYGLVIWAFMNLVVMPFAGMSFAGFDTVALLAVIWHMLLVGLPIAFIAAALGKSKGR